MATATKDLAQVQEGLMALISEDTILIGHGINIDLIVLKIVHKNIVDTLKVFPHSGGWPKKNSLKFLASHFLHRNIQQNSKHDTLFITYYYIYQIVVNYFNSYALSTFFKTFC